MTYHGHVENNAVVVDDCVRLPEGALVEIRIVEQAATEHHPEVLRFFGLIQAGGVDRKDYRDHLVHKYL